MSTDQPVKENAIRQPSLLDALIPLLFMIALLVTLDRVVWPRCSLGPLQVALFMSAVVAAMVAHKNGHSWETLGEEIVKGISLAMSAILILLMVGALIGVWNMSGTIATMVYYGVKYIDPSWFYFAAALLTGIVGIVTGSSWTTAATLGVAFVGMARCHRRFTAITAGAVISGCLFWRQDDPAVRDDHLDPADRGQRCLHPYQQHGQSHHPSLSDFSGHVFLDREKCQAGTLTVDTTAALQALACNLQHQPVELAAGAGLASARNAKISGFSLHPDRHTGGRPGGGGHAAPGRDSLCQ